MYGRLLRLYMVIAKVIYVPVLWNVTMSTNYFATLGEQISPGFGDSLSLWRGPSSTHEFSLEPITQVEVLRHLTH